MQVDAGSRMHVFEQIPSYGQCRGSSVEPADPEPVAGACIGSRRSDICDDGPAPTVRLIPLSCDGGLAGVDRGVTESQRSSRSSGEYGLDFRNN
jgi:hypothetical protein